MPPTISIHVFSPAYELSKLLLKMFWKINYFLYWICTDFSYYNYFLNNPMGVYFIVLGTMSNMEVIWREMINSF